MDNFKHIEDLNSLYTELCRKYDGAKSWTEKYFFFFHTAKWQQDRIDEMKLWIVEEKKEDLFRNRIHKNDKLKEDNEKLRGFIVELALNNDDHLALCRKDETLHHLLIENDDILKEALKITNGTGNTEGQGE